MPSNSPRLISCCFCRQVFLAEAAFLTFDKVENPEFLTSTPQGFFVFYSASCPECCQRKKLKSTDYLIHLAHFPDD